MSPSPLVRLGIVGCGNVLGAYLALAEKLRHERIADVTAFCGRERQRTATLAAWPSAEFVTDFDDLVSRPDVDAIVVLTPMVEHAPMARAALEAGKHVLVEKPLAVALKDARQLIRMAKTRKKLLICAPFTVLSP